MPAGTLRILHGRHQPLWRRVQLPEAFLPRLDMTSDLHVNLYMYMDR